MNRGGPEARVLVLAGPIAGGKSTVASWLEARGAHLLDADRIGHEMLLKTAVVQRLRELFGAEILDPEGGIDRPALGRRIWPDADALRQLEKILHPLIHAELEDRIFRLRRSRATRLIVVEAAIYFRMQPPLACDAVLWISAPENDRRNRLRSRDHLSEDAASQRLARQAGLDEEGRTRADLILETTGPREDQRVMLLAMVDKLADLGWSESDFSGHESGPERAATEER